jgi:hypothetical protein
LIGVPPCLRRNAPRSCGDETLTDRGLYRTQAGPLSAFQLGEAFIRLRAYAYAHDQGLSDSARDIVARRLRLRPAQDPRQDE